MNSLSKHYMVPFNDLIRDHIKKTSLFLEALANPPNSRSFFIPKADLDVNDEPSHATPGQIRLLAESLSSYAKEISQVLTDDARARFLVFHSTTLKKAHEEADFDWEELQKPKEIVLDNTEFDGVSREAFILVREALQLCEDELKELRHKLEEERILRKSMQHIIVNLADSMHFHIDEAVKRHVETIRHTEGVDKEFCNFLNTNQNFKRHTTPNRFSPNHTLRSASPNVPQRTLPIVPNRQSPNGPQRKRLSLPSTDTVPLPNPVGRTDRSKMVINTKVNSIPELRVVDAPKSSQRPVRPARTPQSQKMTKLNPITCRPLPTPPT